MTACDSRRQHLSYVAEATWGEVATSMAGAVALPHLNEIDLSSIRQSMIMSEAARQYKNQTFKNIVGPWADAELTFEFYLTGHGSTTAGAVSLTDFENLIGLVIGNVAVSAASGTTASGTADADTITTTASGTFSAGSLVRVGARGDAKGNGQWAAVATHVTTTMELLTGLDGAPTNTDVVYSAATVSTQETTCTVTSKRFQIQTADLQVVLHGCFVKSYSFSGGAPGEVLKCSVTFGVSWAEPVAATFPNVTLPATTNPAPSGGGSCFLQVYGTTTRSTALVTCRQFSVAVTVGVVPKMGFDGANAYQTIVGAGRSGDTFTVSLTVDAEGADATPTWWDAWATNAIMHLLMGYSTADGSAVACYFPRLFWSGPRPVQMSLNGLNAVPLQFTASTNATTTTELTLSAMRWGFA